MNNSALKSTKKPNSFRQSMSSLHTWIGLLPSWILYFMFITGTAGYFNTEITQWMQPEIPFAGESASQSEMLASAEQRLKTVGAKADEWYIGFPDGRNQFLRIEWEGHLSDAEKEKLSDEGFTEKEIEEKEEALEGEEKLYPKSGLPIEYADGVTEARETGGGNKLYVMHYALYYLPTTFARYLVIFCTLFMLTALVTGVVVHKKIFKDFFTFRPGKKQRSWLDSHNLFSVLSLPFQFMITYSGLLFFLSNIMPVLAFAPIALIGIDLNDALSAGRVKDMSPKNQELIQIVSEEIFNQSKNVELAGTTAVLTPLTDLLKQMNSARPNKSVRYISVENVYDLNARVEVQLTREVGSGNGNHYVFNGVTGERISKEPVIQGNESSLNAVREADTVMRNLHEGRFAPIILRWLYFFSGLMGAAMIATGTILWSVKRREKAEKKGYNSKGLVLVECLNVAVVVGLPIAVAMYFWANRLIPASFPERANWEVNTMFIVWGLMFAHAALCPRRRVWIDQLWLGAMVCGLLPLLNFFTTDRHLGISLVQGDRLMAGFDLTMLAFGVAFGLTALSMHKRVSGFAVKASPPTNLVEGALVSSSANN